MHLSDYCESWHTKERKSPPPPLPQEPAPRRIRTEGGAKPFKFIKIGGELWSVRDAVFLRAVKIPFTEDAIRRHLGIRIDLPYPGVDDAFEGVVKVYKEGNLNMTDVFGVIGREDTNWADDPAVDTIPNPLDHAILNAHASA
ncbi:hypothetical protein PIB30_066569 [Stylosanthes scabra]|uniref:Uncharacterized protein n=1 Tax=Stylosanthes scabra TaxID=79078 RepID=A0ABU6RMI8_9FABA|nr:hypothetical protein [Stylosanthes scabra]